MFGVRGDPTTSFSLVDCCWDHPCLLESGKPLFKGGNLEPLFRKRFSHLREALLRLRKFGGLRRKDDPEPIRGRL